MYSHGIGTLFLPDSYGMTHQPEIREKPGKTVRLIVDTQNAEGGWRYHPVRRDAGLSVTICHIAESEPNGGRINRDDRFIEGDPTIVRSFGLPALTAKRIKV